MGIALSWLNITMPLANSLFLCYDQSVAKKKTQTRGGIAMQKNRKMKNRTERPTIKGMAILAAPLRVLFLCPFLRNFRGEKAV